MGTVDAISLTVVILIEATIIAIPGIIAYILGTLWGNFILLSLGIFWVGISGIYAIVDRLVTEMEDRIKEKQ